MKAVILAGGFGTRISEESHLRPKPMVEIGGYPILWHILKIYSSYGINEFVICLGYKGYFIKEYFVNYFLHKSNLTIDLSSNSIEYHSNSCEPWKITLVDTGEGSDTGGRLKRVGPYLNDEAFCFTYGDGVADVNIAELIRFHEDQGLFATMTAVQPPGKFGALDLDGHRIQAFKEKPRGDASWINGGFFVLSPRVLDYIPGDETSWEQEPLTRLAREGQLAAYRHDGFWQCMDTLKHKNLLEALWQSGKAPWKIW
ncbi:Glucose-1-phosphate cytidylyltransferase [Desulfovibrio sp. DV]|uniref:glucose-1-phosphate cytidylyltransferase n=1 Tax=Desulfovibrio sp. DV TaxID=1844708 RepID=UPI00094B8CAF|nr:glucose-1-phosphate cytidylyltransferase [Desulfovibrio sp. DV]OLN24911.1 Glucose-1-phosphate cytidylyltransferase [Desulfovibrio sp. DV]